MRYVEVYVLVQRFLPVGSRWYFLAKRVQHICWERQFSKYIFDAYKNVSLSHQTTYQYVLEACILLTTTNNYDDNRGQQHKIITNLFQHCCMDGLLNDLILNMIQLSCSTSFQETILGGVNVQLSHVPVEWTENNSSSHDNQNSTHPYGRRQTWWIQLTQKLTHNVM